MRKVETMASRQKLSAADRIFFGEANQAVFSNPFSDDDIGTSRKATRPAPAISKGDRIYDTIQRVDRKLKRIEKQGGKKIQDFVAEDRPLIKNAFLFDFFYRFRKQFDQLIQNQIMAGDTPVKVDFSREALALLEQRGFIPEDTRRYFALAYQLRRAFYFIAHSLIGCSPIMKKLRLNLWNNVFTHNLDLYDRYLWNRMEDFSTLLLGETGTGKGTAAMAIGRSGYIPFDEDRQSFVESFTRSFVSLNLSQFPETLIESELFGHRKGAFTGAVEDYKGVFERCSPYGAILLDEIGEISIPIQIKLLQVLQERIFNPVGSHQQGRFQGRVIAATNRAREEIIQGGIFRDDFYYRLCTDIITVPPLRQRIREAPRELDDLLAHTVERMVGVPSAELTGMVREVIDTQMGKDYPWPGNVRELEQCVRRVLLKRSYEGTPAAPAPDLETRLTEQILKGEIDIANLVSGYCRLLYDRYGTFEEVARRTRLDRRTVKKYIASAEKAAGQGGKNPW